MKGEYMQIYGQLYDIVAENFQGAGRKFEYEKSTFLCDVGSHPQNIDVSGYLGLPNPMFFQAVFVTAFRRLPEEKEINRWKVHFSKDQAAFQREFLQYIAHSSVAAINHISLTNNPYFKQKPGIRYRLLGALYGLTDKSSLREFGKKLPQPIQRIIRKVFL